MRVPALLLVAAVVTSSGHAAAGPDFGHLASLPARDPGSVLGAVPGEPPSGTHARGTVIVAESSSRCGTLLYEWEVSRGRILREVCLEARKGGARLARAGGTLEVLSNWPSLGLSQIDVSSFHVTHRTPVLVSTDQEVTRGAWLHWWDASPP